MKTNKMKEEFMENKFQLYLDEDQKFEEIQMANLAVLSRNDPHYVKFEEQNNESSHFYSKNSPNRTGSKNHCHQNIFTDQPVVPTTSCNFEPNKICMNGTTFVHKDAIKGVIKTQNKTKKPEMQVICERCCSAQMVPANTHSFICFNCDCIQGCNPQFGIVICGGCQRKVWYPLGISNLIKCTKCGAINKIPFVENYQRNQSPYYYKNQEKISLKEQEIQNQGYLTEKYFTQRHPM